MVLCFYLLDIELEVHLLGAKDKCLKTTILSVPKY